MNNNIIFNGTTGNYPNTLTSNIWPSGICEGKWTTTTTITPQLYASITEEPKVKLFQYAVCLIGDNECKEDNCNCIKAEDIVISTGNIIADSLEQAKLKVAMDIPAEYKSCVKNIQIFVKPF